MLYARLQAISEDANLPVFKATLWNTEQSERQLKNILLYTECVSLYLCGTKHYKTNQLIIISTAASLSFPVLSLYLEWKGFFINERWHNQYFHFACTEY